jgi:hypothetical protein
MTALGDLTANAQITREPHPSDIIEKMTLEGTKYAGSLVFTGTAVKTVAAAASADQTDHFAGLLLEGGVAGEVVDVLRRGRVRVALNETIAQTDDGAAVYATNATTPSDNPGDITLTSSNNAKIGKIAMVHTASTALLNETEIYFEASAYQSV